jgi:hypothetical protein
MCIILSGIEELWNTYHSFQNRPQLRLFFDYESAPDNRTCYAFVDANLSMNAVLLGTG